jgi:glutamate-1-semialdehyde 2,1-aminomutase
MSVAIRIARAKTDRDLILFSGYHGWSDWYLAANLANESNLDGQLMPGLSPKGVPRGLANTAIPFDSGSIPSLRKVISGKEKKIAAIVIEPARGNKANSKYLSTLKDLAREFGAVLIFDEITSGFRQCTGGLHIAAKVKPDIAVFAKSISNGYPIGVVIGTEEVMEAAQNTFISSTNWTDAIGPAAAIATIKKFKRDQVANHLNKMGQAVQKIWETAGKNHNLNITVSGIPSLSAFQFNHPRKNTLNTFFTVSCLEYGILGFRQFKPSYSHDLLDIERYSIVVDHIFEQISEQAYNVKVDTPVHHTGFKRLTSE